MVHPLMWIDGCKSTYTIIRSYYVNPDDPRVFSYSESDIGVYKQFTIHFDEEYETPSKYRYLISKNIILSRDNKGNEVYAVYKEEFNEMWLVNFKDAWIKVISTYEGFNINKLINEN